MKGGANMIEVDVTLFMIPVLLLIWAVDAYVFLVSLRWVLRAIPSVRDRAWAIGVVELADRFPNALRARYPEVSAWLPWVGLRGLLLFRYVLVHSVLLREGMP